MKKQPKIPAPSIKTLNSDKPYWDPKDAGHAAWAVGRWAVGRWVAEVQRRPLCNVHRASLDAAWRQVYRRFSAGPTAIPGKPHILLMALATRLFEGGNLDSYGLSEQDMNLVKEHAEYLKERQKREAALDSKSNPRSE